MKMQCINKATKKLKKTFKTFTEAVAWAKDMNKNPKFIHKQVAYKCQECLYFHTGRSPHNTLLHHKTDIYENNNHE
jgi:hypothetical protein